MFLLLWIDKPLASVEYFPLAGFAGFVIYGVNPCIEPLLQPNTIPILSQLRMIYFNTNNKLGPEDKECC